MSDVHDHDIQQAVDQLKSEGRDQYLDREPDSPAAEETRPASIFDLWWGIRPHRSNRHEKSKEHEK
ncbi:CotG/ExsB N-terminal domain-containing protein, partial [Bacillus sp. TH008]|uniref:CotG/ExsB N-terminal domain-containing protein n=3 Tax=Bacillus TaxID=1386 RepID=UPI000617590D